MSSPIKLLPTSASYGGTITQRGEDHQLFVIARVQGRRRCVAAFSCQWLFGQMVVNAADRLMRAFINPINAAAIASELAFLEELEIDNIAETGAEEDENPATLCPYLTGLFMTAFRIDMGRNRLHELNLAKINAAPDRIEHRNDYTCFDVTEPGKPRYCFWWAGSKPLGAIGYLRDEEDNQIDIAILRLIKEFPRLDAATLAAVWPEEFNKHVRRGQTAGDTTAQSPAADSSPHYPHILAAASKVRGILSSDRGLSISAISSMLGSLTQPGLLGLLRTELLATRELNANGVLLLKLLLTEEKSKLVDLKPWLSTDALHAASLVELADALSHAEFLDVSFSPTLTTEILEDLVPRLPNLRHVAALGYMGLNPLTKVLPLTTYLTSLPLLDAVDQSRLRTPESTSTPECLRWVEESDPPPALTVVLYAPSLEVFIKPKIPRRYGVELAHLGAEGVVHGFTRFMERLYDPNYLGSQSGCYFEMRGYFHATCAAPVRDCIGPESSDTAACYAYGCLPSLIRDGRDSKIESSAGTGSLTNVPRYPGWVLALDTKGTMPYHQPKPGQEPERWEAALQDRLGGFDVSAFLDHATEPTSVAAQHARPEPTGRGKDVWLLLPDEPPEETAQRRSRASPGAANTSGATGDGSTPFPDDTPHPEYAFERWDVLPDEKEKGLQPVERISVREWVARLPAGHGKVSEALLSQCEAVLASLDVRLRSSSGTWDQTAPTPAESQSVDIPPLFPMILYREGALDWLRGMGSSGTLEFTADELNSILAAD